MFCFADATGETLAALLRPGNAGANTVADHHTVVDRAIAQLPTEIAQGHKEGDDRGEVRRPIVVRADSAGCTKDFLAGLRRRNIGFFVTARANVEVEAAIFDAVGIEEVWLPALDQGGDLRPGTQVCELTSLIKGKNLPFGTRLIVRREPLHPGAQRSLFPSLEYRYWGFYTDQEGKPEELDVMMRAHAHVEAHIQRLKDSGLSRFPFRSFSANETWLQLVALSADLVRWFQILCLEGAWRNARPKALRWNLFHAPARVITTARRRIVRILDGWPASEILVNAYERIPALT
jgi:hypothetical protein